MTADLDALVTRARSLATCGGRRVLGIAGAPGAGKSTLVAALLESLGGLAVGVPMDGFHLAQKELERLDRADRKGAPDTFDVAGYVSLLRRLRERGREPVYAPTFDRVLEEPIAGSIRVDQDVPLVITEGNYLLLDHGPWSAVRGLLEQTWFVQIPPELRVQRLVDRHVRHGREPEAAHTWVQRSDEANARLVEETRDRADLTVVLE